MNAPEAKATMRNAIGQDVPAHLVKDVDKLRDELVRDIARDFVDASGLLAALKKRSTESLEAFLSLSAQRFGQDLGGKKGNVTVYSYDGKVKIVRNVQDAIVFDEGLAAAKELIDQYLDSLMQGVPGEVRQFVEKAFRPNSAGKISTSAVLGLRSLAINDERWITAMHAVDESLKVISSKAYTDEEASPGTMDILLDGGMPRSRAVVLNGAMKVGVQWEMAADGIADLKAFFRVVQRTGEDFDALLPLDDGIIRRYQSRFVAGSFKTAGPSGWNGFIVAAQFWVMPHICPENDGNQVDLLCLYGIGWRNWLNRIHTITNSDLPDALHIEE